MEVSTLRNKLFKYSKRVVFKEGFVFTVFVSGKGLSKANTSLDIQALVLACAEPRFPLIEVMVSEDHYFLMILKPKQ